jgi:hypothetical protein
MSSSSSSVISSWSIREKAKFSNVSGKQLASIPVEVSGTISVKSPIPTSMAVVVLIDNVVAGFVGEAAKARPGTVKFRTMLDYARLTPGRHAITLATVSGSPSEPVFAVVGSPR